MPGFQLPLQSNTPEDPGNGNGWSTYAKLVLSELERLEDSNNKTDNRVTDLTEKVIPYIHTEIATLQTKAMIFGAGAGFIVSAICVAIAEYIFHHN